jgi:hypothetical protein
VARTKSTARPMTSEELASAGVSPTRERIHDSENVLSRVDCSTPGTAHDFGSHEDGEIRPMNKSGGEEDLSNFDAGPSELVNLRSVKLIPRPLCSTSPRLQLIL